MRFADRRAFTLIELLVVVAIIALLISILLPSLAKAREQAKKAFCANNLSQLGRAVNIYAGEYKYFTPHNPYAPWLRTSWIGLSSDDIDPSMGWLLTSAMRMAPPDKWKNGHFKWIGLNEDELPDIVVCPAAIRELMFNITSPEIDSASPYESTIYQYAAFYQMCGTIRCGTDIIKKQQGNTQGIGGTNPVVPNPQSASTAQPVDNCQAGSPYVWVYAKGTANKADPSDTDAEQRCFIQAVEPSQIDMPGRVYYMADSHEYRPVPGGWPPGTISDGWHSQGIATVGQGNYVIMGARHGGVPNAVYMDGHASSEGLGHPGNDWNMSFDSTTGKAKSDQWRCSTWTEWMAIANIGNQQHTMPRLMVAGWELILGNKGK
jgi:prepilin-type N-terminal cleavage/methylation domain-containing protein/prepilin-type processing-associated H-X9-DG protein